MSFIKKNFKIIVLVVVLLLCAGVTASLAKPKEEPQPVVEVNDVESLCAVEYQVLDGEEVISSRSVYVEAGTPAITLMDGHEYEMDGTLVTSIEGIENSPETNTYWMLYKNGNMAPVGIMDLTIEQDCSITWRYETCVW